VRKKKRRAREKSRILKFEFRNSIVAVMLLSVGRLWQKGSRVAVMQPSTRPMKKQIHDLRERMQENVIHHVG
jgi:hypothetical protein